MKRDKFGKILSVTAVALILAASAWAQGNLNSYYLQVISLVAIYSILAVSFNLIYGFAGQFSLALAGIAAIGGYTLALLSLTPVQKIDYFLTQPAIWPISVIQLPFVPALILGGILATAVGLIVGIPALRLRGDYLLMATLGFSEIIRLIMVNVPQVTNGALGLKGVPRHASLPVLVGILAITVFVIKRLVDSSYGRALKSIREDEIAAEALGINLFRHKLLAFAISCFFTGIGGALMIDSLGAVDPKGFKPVFTYIIITMVVLGGVGSISGSILGAAVYTIMAELLRPIEYSRTIFGITTPDLPGFRTLLFAAMLVLLMLFRRQGLMGGKEFSWRGTWSTVQRLLSRVRPQGGES